MDKKGKSEDAEKGYDFSKAISSQKQFRFGARDSNTITVDVSLANLFQRLTVECSGILGNPQWKHFRHMELLKTEQIRLSNGIWRSWYMQFQRGVKPRFCKFEIDPRRDEICHSQPQGIVLEGKYWKRTDSAVAMEYRKWRIYGKKKSKWSSIRRIPNVSTTSQGSMQQLTEPQVVQTDTADYKLNQIFQAIDDFPEALLMDISRPGDERSYMRPIVESAEIIQQPYLGMLNPHIDEIMFEPMEVMFPTLGSIPGRFSGTQGGSSPFHFQQPPPHHGGLEQPGSRLPTSTPQPYSNSSQVQYETSSQYVNIPQRNPRDYGGNQHQSSTIPFNMDPANYLNMSVDPRLHPQPDVMDIGTPPIQSIMKHDVGKIYNSGQTTPTTPYATPTQSFVPSSSSAGPQGNDKITSLITELISEESPMAPPTDPKPAPLRSANFTHPQQYSDRDIQQQAFEPSSQTEMERLAQEMKRMEEEHLEKIKELEYQQQLASRQYLTLLQEYVSKSGSQRPSQQQQEVLMSVLSDPMSLNILKEILKDESNLTSTIGSREPPAPPPPLTTPTASNTNPHFQIKKEHNPSAPSSCSPYTSQIPPTHTSTPVISPPSVPPISTEMDTVSDFQSRLIMAAAAQATLPPMDMHTTNLYQTKSQLMDGSSSSSMVSLMTTPTSGSDGTLDMPPSPALMKKFKNVRNLTPDEKKVYQELRRQSHITAEQRRRGSIKSGFDQLQSLVINPANYPSGKISKATILEKTIEHIQSHHQEREGRAAKMKRLKEEMKELNDAILRCQEELPASGAPVTRQRFEENRQMFQEYIRQRTQHNYKFWIYSIIIQQLFDSYNSMVSTSSIGELRQTVLSWFEQSCGLPSLRPIVMSSLRELSMKTSLSDPVKLPEQQMNDSSSSN